MKEKRIPQTVIDGHLYDLGTKHEHCADGDANRSLHCWIAQGDNMCGVQTVSRLPLHGQIVDGDKSSRTFCTVMHQNSGSIHAKTTKTLKENGGVDGIVKQCEYEASLRGLAGRLAGGSLATDLER